MSLPIEISEKILQKSDPKDWPEISKVTRSFHSILHSPRLMMEKSRQYAIPTAHSLPNFLSSWRIRQNWNEGKYWCRQLLQGQVCYHLDGIGNRAISARCDGGGRARMWDLETGQITGTEVNGVCSATLNRDISLYGMRDGRLILKDLRRKGEVDCLGGISGEINAVGIKGWSAVGGSSDGTTLISDLRQSKPLHLHHSSSPITAIAMNKKNIIIGSLDGTLEVISRTTSQTDQIDSYKLQRGAINCITTNGPKIYTGHDSGAIHFLTSDEENNVSMVGEVEMSSPVVCMRRHRDRLVAGHANGVISYRKVDGLDHEVRYIPEGGGIVWQLWSDDCKILSSSLDERLRTHHFRDNYQL